jgi:glycosyltransferase involved in cell wall biosynthesis
MDKPNPRRIGVLDFTSPDWTAGATFTRMLAWSLTQVCREDGTEIIVLTENEANLAKYKLPVKILQVPTPLLGLPPRISHSLSQQLLRCMWSRPDQKATFNAYATASEYGISVVLPPGVVPDWTAGVRTIGWIPDFQHRHLPHYFTEEERHNRDRLFQILSERADVVLLSSRTAHGHFAAFAPHHVYKARVVSFPSLLAFESPAGDPTGTRRKYHLPEKFALVVNQLWVHKNHELVVEGLRRLRRKGVRIPVVMTGVPADHRDPGNRLLSRLLQSVATSGLSDQVTLLGEVPRDDVIDLMRAAEIVIQPSRFEGWSTVVQDAKALGRPLLCSDIPVHREQVPGATGFFPCDEPDVLADLLASHWQTLSPGPDFAREQQALAEEREFAALHGRSLLGLCREVAAS